MDHETGVLLIFVIFFALLVIGILLVFIKSRGRGKDQVVRHEKFLNGTRRSDTGDRWEDNPANPANPMSPNFYGRQRHHD